MIQGHLWEVVMVFRIFHEFTLQKAHQKQNVSWTVLHTAHTCLGSHLHPFSTHTFSTALLLEGTVTMHLPLCHFFFKECSFLSAVYITMTVFCSSSFEKLARGWEHRLNSAIESLEAEITGPNSPLDHTDFTQWQVEWEAQWMRTGRHWRKRCLKPDSVQGSEEPSSLLLHKFDILFWSSFGKTVVSLNLQCFEPWACSSSFYNHCGTVQSSFNRAAAAVILKHRLLWCVIAQMCLFPDKGWLNPDTEGHLTYSMSATRASGHRPANSSSLSLQTIPPAPGNGCSPEFSSSHPLH